MFEIVFASVVLVLAGIVLFVTGFKKDSVGGLLCAILGLATLAVYRAVTIPNFKGNGKPMKLLSLDEKLIYCTQFNLGENYLILDLGANKSHFVWDEKQALPKPGCFFIDKRQICRHECRENGGW